MYELKLAGIIVLISVVGGLAGGMGINAWMKADMRATCVRFAQETGQETKFSEYTYWSYDCLTRQNDGMWSSIYQMRSTK